jgi:hypothetical protein
MREVPQRNRNRKVGSGNKRIGHHVGPEERRGPQEAVSVRHETGGFDELHQGVLHGHIPLRQTTCTTILCGKIPITGGAVNFDHHSWAGLDFYGVMSEDFECVSITEYMRLNDYHYNQRDWLSVSKLLQML